MFFFIFKDFIYLFLERGKRREKEGEKHQCVVASCASPTGDLARNPGMCPDWESNQRPFVSQVSAQSTEAHQSGLDPKSLSSKLTRCHVVMLSEGTVLILTLAQSPAGSSLLPPSSPVSFRIKVPRRGKPLVLNLE